MQDLQLACSQVYILIVPCASIYSWAHGVVSPIYLATFIPEKRLLSQLLALELSLALHIFMPVLKRLTNFCMSCLCSWILPYKCTNFT